MKLHGVLKKNITQLPREFALYCGLEEASSAPLKADSDSNSDEFPDSQ